MNQLIGISRKAIISKHTLTCPTCSEAVFVAHAARSEVPNRRYWLSDGDTVGGVFQALTNQQRSADAFSYELLVGACPSCESQYYVVETSFMPAHPDAEEYLHFNMPLDIEKNYICSMQIAVEGVPSTWLQQEYSTPIGVMLHHVFGPYKLLNSDSVVGPNGVSSCGGGGLGDSNPWNFARNLLLAAWDSLRTTNVAIASVEPH